MRVEPLDPSRHNRKDFDCGRPELNEWLATRAANAQKKQSARTFVLTNDGTKILGFYALTAHAVAHDAVSSSLARGHSPYFQIPAVLLARLAIAKDYQGKGHGERLLADSVRRVIAFSTNVAVGLLVVDALDDTAAAFYEQYGFARYPEPGLRLFARIQDVAATFGV